MRREKRKKKKPEVGDVRIAHRFFIFPRNLKKPDGNYESRNFELCHVKQERSKLEKSGNPGIGTLPSVEYYWKNIEWAD